MKNRLIIIAIMFVIINLVFYFGFDSSDESEKSIELENTNQLTNETNSVLEQEISVAITP